MSRLLRLPCLLLFLPVLICSTAPLAAQVCLPAPSDMISWWPGQSTAVDVVDSNDGSLVGGATYGVGKVGQAFSFDGIDGQVYVPHNANQNTGTQMTIDAWIFQNTLGHGRPIAQKRTPTNTGGFTFETTGSPFGSDGLQFVIWIAGFAHVGATPGGFITAGVWQHVAATFDGSVMKIYIDGVERASAVVAGAIDASAEAFVMGHNVVISSFNIDGLLDEVHLFSRALSAVEIMAIYNADSAGICPSPTAVTLPEPGLVLAQNYPNPFNPGTVIAYELPDEQYVRLAVYDVNGHRVRSLVNETAAAGPHAAAWDGNNERGERSATGVYFYRLEAGATILTRKMVLLR